MARTEEQVKQILNNPEGALRMVCPEADKVQFSTNPETAETQKLLMLYYISTTPVSGTNNPETRAADIQKIADRVTGGDDEFARYASALKGEARGKMLEELAAADKSACTLEKTVLAKAAAHTTANDPTRAIDTYVNNMFAPVLPEKSALQNTFTGADKDFMTRLQAADKAARGIKLDVPEGLSEREVTLAAMGRFFMGDIVGQVGYDVTGMTKTIPGLMDRKFISCGTEELEGSNTIIRSMFTSNEPRAEMHTGRFHVSEARADTAKAIRHFTENGDRMMLAESLQMMVYAGMNNARMSKDILEPQNVALLGAAIEADNLLGKPDYAKLVEWTPRERARIDNLRQEYKLIQEAAQLKEDVLDYASKHYNEKLTAIDPEIVNKMDRWGKIKVGMEYVRQSRTEIRENAPQEGSTEKQIFFTHRLPDDFEVSLMKPNALNVYYGVKFANSAFRKDCMEAKTGADLAKAFSREVTPRDFLENGILNIAYVTNNRLRNLSENITANYDARGKGFDEFSTIVRQTAYGVALVNGEPVSVADKNPTLKNDSTPETLMQKMDYLRSVRNMVSEKFPDPIIGKNPDGKDVNLVDEFKNGIRQTEQLIEQHLQTIVPEKQNVQKINTIYTMMAEAKTNGDALIFKDEAGKTLRVGEAAERFHNGRPLVMEQFVKGHFLGVRQPISAGENGKVVYGKADPSPMLRTTDCRVKDATPAKQLETLRYVKEALDKTQSFFVKNSKQFNSLMKTLDEVIKAQEGISGNPNVRQVKTLNEMYDKLHKDAKAYVDYKKPSVKDSDVRGRTRLAGIESLMSVTDPKYVREVADRGYPQQNAMNKQMKESKEIIELAEHLTETYANQDYKGRNPGKVLLGQELIELYDGYHKIADHVESNGLRNEYLPLVMAPNFKKLMDLCEKTFGESYKADAVNRFAERCDKAAAKYAQMSPDITPKPAQPAAKPAKKIDAPKAGAGK